MFNTVYMISPMVRRPGFNPRLRHAKDFKKWYLIPPCFTLGNIHRDLFNGHTTHPSLKDEGVSSFIVYGFFSQVNFAQLAGAVEYTDCNSAESKDPHSTSVLDMTLNNLMVRFSNAGALGMQSTPLLPSLPGPLWPGMVTPDRALSMG